MDFTYQAKNSDHQNDIDNIAYFYYTLFGNHSDIDHEGNPTLRTDSNKVFAKKMIDNDNIKYFIKVGIYGRIYNPIGLYSEGRHTKFLTKTGKKEYEFKQVSKKIFDMYLNFLRSKNIAWLHNAEREMT